MFRRQLEQEKRDIVQKKSLLAAEKEKMRQQKLQELAATVPYYEKIVNSEADINKTTKCRENDIYEKDETGLMQFQHGQKKRHFFTDEKLFSNFRFRLADELSRAGMSQTKYARDVIKNIIPRNPERTTGIVPF